MTGTGPPSSSRSTLPSGRVGDHRRLELRMVAAEVGGLLRAWSRPRTGADPGGSRRTAPAGAGSAPCGARCSEWQAMQRTGSKPAGPQGGGDRTVGIAEVMAHGAVAGAAILVADRRERCDVAGLAALLAGTCAGRTARPCPRHGHSPASRVGCGLPPVRPSASIGRRDRAGSPDAPAPAGPGSPPVPPRTAARTRAAVPAGRRGCATGRRRRAAPLRRRSRPTRSTRRGRSHARAAAAVSDRGRFRPPSPASGRPGPPARRRRARGCRRPIRPRCRSRAPRYRRGGTRPRGPSARCRCRCRGRCGPGCRRC